MNFNDTQPMRGIFSLEAWCDGERVLLVDECNLIVNNAKAQLANLIGGNGANRQITQIGFGTGVAALSPDNTDLAAGAFWKPVTSVAYPYTGQVAFSWSLSTAEANGLAITEFGLRCADATLFSRKVRSPINKASDLSLTGTWTIIF